MNLLGPYVRAGLTQEHVVVSQNAVAVLGLDHHAVAAVRNHAVTVVEQLADCIDPETGQSALAERFQQILGAVVVILDGLRREFLVGTPHVVLIDRLFGDFRGFGVCRCRGSFGIALGLALLSGGLARGTLLAALLAVCALLRLGLLVDCLGAGRLLLRRLLLGGLLLSRLLLGLLLSVQIGIRRVQVGIVDPALYRLLRLGCRLLGRLGIRGAGGGLLGRIRVCLGLGGRFGLLLGLTFGLALFLALGFALFLPLSLLLGLLLGLILLVLLRLFLLLEFDARFPLRQGGVGEDQSAGQNKRCRGFQQLFQGCFLS